MILRITVPVHLQRLSLDPALLLPQAATAAAPPLLLSDPAARLASLNLANGSFVYLSYPSDARSSQPPPPKGLSPAGSFGKKMTMDDLIARQIRVEGLGVRREGGSRHLRFKAWRA